MVRCILIVLALALILLCLWQGTVESQSAAAGARDSTRSGLVELDSAIVFQPLGESGVFSRRFEQNTARPLTTYLAVSADRFYGIERYELSRTQCALVGADTGLTLGLMAAALGMTAGLWDDETGWAIAGAAAVLGALRGASKSDEPEFRIRLRWEDPD